MANPETLQSESWTARLLRDRRTLAALVRPRRPDGSLAERLSNFYGPQADDYDRFRSRLLHGRQPLLEALPAAEGDVWIDFGGGTGSSLALLGPRLARLRHFYVVDLARPLLDVARARVERAGWTNVTCLEANAATLELPPGSATVVLFSYSLTMMPNWFDAIDRARDLLAPGGVIGVVDYYVSRRHAPPLSQHGAFTRRFWPWWFAHCEVFLSPDHVPYLSSRFTPTVIEESFAPVPYLPAVRVPYYRFIGRRP